MHSPLFRIGVVAGLLLAVVTVPASASTIYMQALMADHSGSYGWNSQGPDNYSGGSTQQIANQFSIGTAAIVTDLTWYGSYQFNSTPDTPTDFVIQFYGDSAGVPGALLYQTAVTSGAVASGQSNSDGDTIYSWGASIPAFALAAGTIYYVSIRENDTSPDNIWTWSFTDGLFTAYSINTFSSSWGGTFAGNAYALNGTPVPEPATLLLLGTGLGAVAARRRLKKRV